MTQIELFENVTSLDVLKDIKLCIKCNEWKPVNSFVTGSRGGGGLDPDSKPRERVCKKCRNKQNVIIRKLKETHPTPKKGYKCPICLEIADPPSLDHDHETGAFRGWLCNKCNAALGFFNDDLDRLKRAVKYTKEFEDNKPLKVIA